MLRTTKKELIFFEDFDNIMDVICKGTREFEKIFSDYQNLIKYTETLSEYEHECDVLGHKVFERVNQSFITPIDREDIVDIVKSLDDIMDKIEETAHRFAMYNIKEVKPEAVRFSKLIVEAVDELQKLIHFIPEKNREEMKKLIISINKLENDGDDLYRQEIAKLFRDESDAVEVIRWSNIYDSLEESLDACEVVANLVEGIVMKNA